MTAAAIQLPLEYVDLEGRKWHPYDVHFNSPDGTYSVYLYALSYEHAMLQLDALKETAHIPFPGHVIASIPTGPSC